MYVYVLCPTPKRNLHVGVYKRLPPTPEAVNTGGKNVKENMSAPGRRR